MNKTQELKERIHSHCPELKELSFGCRVEFWNLDGYSQIVQIVSKESYEKHLSNPKLDGAVNLGHPIHLEHVLRATRDCMGIDFGFENGWFVQYLAMQTKKRIEYDLTKSFEQNCENPELVDFLLEVIK